MRKLDDKIFLVEENEQKDNAISIRMIDENTFEVRSNNIDERWEIYDSKTLNKLHKGLFFADRVKCLMKGKITDALMLAYTLRATMKNERRKT